MQTNPEMSEHLKSAIADGDPAALYAAARIEELERQLEAERHTAERTCGLLADTVEALQTEREKRLEAEEAVCGLISFAEEEGWR